MSRISTVDNLVEITDLSFKRNSRFIFNGVDMAIPRGKITAIMGPSGSGKTTLLQLIGGQLRPLKGSIKVAGQIVHTLRRLALYKLRKKIGMLFQSGGLFTQI